MTTHSCSLPAALGTVVVAVMAAGQSLASAHWLELETDILRRIQQASIDLAEPLTPSERFRWLVPFSHLWGGGQPHLHAIHVLAKTGIPAASFGLVQFAGDSEFPYRREAIETLGLVPHVVAVPVLLEALEDSDAEIRIAGISSLAMLSRKHILDDRQKERFLRLHRRLIEEDPDATVRSAATTALPSNGIQGLATVLQRPRSSWSSVSEACRQVRARAFFLRKAPRPMRQSFMRLLIDEARGPTPSYLARTGALAEVLPVDGWPPCVDPRSEAIRGLGLVRARSAQTLLGQIANTDPDPAMRAAAVTAIESLGGEFAEAVIIAALDDPNLEVRSRAISAVASFKNTSQTRLVKQLTRRFEQDKSTVLRTRIATASEDLPGDWTALVNALVDPSVVTRRAAEVSLLARGQPEEMTLLVQALQQDARLAIRAARILSAWPREEATNALIDVVESGPMTARSRAALALGLRGDERAREPLEQAARSDLPEVAIASLQALQDLDLPDSLTILEAISAQTADMRIREAADNAYNLIARSVLAINAERPVGVIEGESK